MARFFVSYSRSVKDEVGKVIDLLRANGHEVWWDGDIPIMADWWATILDRIEWCEVFIFVTSEKSVESPYCIAELQYANERGRPILPFMLENPATLKLPSELPHRSQWLMYDGDPANMLGQINTAYNLIDWRQYTDINTPRPPEPNKGGVSLAKQYQDARQFAFEMEFEKAKSLLRNIKRLDYGEWGQDCDKWLGIISAYTPLIELVQHESTYDKAQRDWQDFVRQYGNEFDPYQIEQKLKTRGSTRKLPIVWIVVTVIVIIVFVLIGIALSGDEGNANTPSTRNESPTTTVVQAALNMDTPEPTMTEISTLTGSEILQTVEAEWTHTAQTQAILDLTLTVVQQSSINQTSTAEQFAASETVAYATIFALSATPTPTPTPDPLELAQAGVENNTDWTPIEQEFDGVTMVLVPAGCFDMGSNDDDSDEQPIHEICFDEPFWIDKYEVTNAQFGSIGCSAYSSEPDQPRNCVDWFEASDFCESRAARLPTEAEWEYAARGVDSWVYPWGNDFEGNNVVYGSNSGGETASVGSRPRGASWVGAMDMSGNLWEWVSSWYLDYPYDAGHEDSINNYNYRVLRGGSFVNTSNALRSANRFRRFSDIVSNDYGFRCARSY